MTHSSQQNGIESSSLNKTEWQAGISLASVYVLRMLGLFMVMPVIAVAALEYPDYSALWVGLAIGGYGLTQAIFQIPMGVLSDKWGRKPIIYSGLLLFAIGSLIAGLADSMWLLTIGRILQGSGAIAGAIMALATDVTRESQRTKIMGLIGVSIGFSFYLALLLGPLIAINIGLQGIFLLTALFSLLALPVIKFGIKTPELKQPTGDALPKIELLGGLAKHRYLWRLNISVLVIHLLITSFFVQVPMLLMNIGVPLAEHWWLYTVVLFASVVGLFLLIKLADHLAFSLSYKLALLIVAVAFVVLLTQTQTWLTIALAGILFFTGFNFLEAKLPSMVSSIAPAGSKGSAMGIYASHQFFGAFLGGLLSGLMNSFYSAQHTFIMCLVFIFLLSLLGKGFTGVQRIKRVTLSLQIRHVEAHSIVDIQQRIESLIGVKEVVIDLDDLAMYLKVDAKAFNMTQAQQILEK